jgi:CHASE2 domain-containing sensor protein
MQHQKRKRLKKRGNWHLWALPGMAVVGLMIMARLTGSLQFLEWISLDLFLGSRPAESPDDRVVIVGIDEADIQRIGTHPIPDQEIARLLETLETYQPTVIGLDMFRDLPVEPGHAKLMSVFQKSRNIIAVERVLRPQIPPPSGVPPERVGFSDVLLDGDGRVRRSLLGTPNPGYPGEPKEYRFSLAQRLAIAYLAPQGISVGNGLKDKAAIRFGSTEFPRLRANSGGYIRLDAGGVQTLLNYRSGAKPFRKVSLSDIEAGRVEPSRLRDRIVIVGVTVASDQNNLRSDAIAGLNPMTGWMYGAEFQAHATSQIISAVLDGRPLLRAWPDRAEYLWIFSWGILGICLGRFSPSFNQSLLGISLASLSLIGCSYWLLLAGWWIPIVPTFLILAANGLGYTAFNQYDRILKSRIEERQRTIEQTFNVIHNGPLQTLSTILRRVQDRDISPEQLLSTLENLNREIREVGEYLKQDALTQEESLYLRNGLNVDLKPPIHQLLYEVYSSTLERDFLGFKTLKVKIRSFEPIDDQHLSLEQKRGLCQFLEEALCNVGKHAQGATRLSVTGVTTQDGWYILQVMDNGPGLSSSNEGEGTKHCLRLKTQLKGKFRRESFSPHGTLCELTWPLTKP